MNGADRMQRLLTEAEGDDKWIQKAIKRPGRCKDFGGPDCPPGSPQYNLAKRFKKGGDLHKGEAKEDKASILHAALKSVDKSARSMYQDLRHAENDVERNPSSAERSIRSASMDLHHIQRTIRETLSKVDRMK